MATLEDYLAKAQTYLTAQDVANMSRNELLAHGALEKMLAALKSSESLDRFSMDVGSLVRVAGQSRPWGNGSFRTFYSDGQFIVPNDATSLRIWCAAPGGSGAGPANYNDGVLSEGVDGGTSAVVGPGIAISATGGQGGSTDGTGGAGGVGSGGDENYTGGRGGNGAVDGDAVAGGGGGGNATQLGDGGRGGDAYAANGVEACAGGGGSVFPGGDGNQYGSGGGASASGAGETPTALTTSTPAGGPDCTGGSTTSGVSVWPFDSIQKLHPFDGFWYAGARGKNNQGNGSYTYGHGGAAAGAMAVVNQRYNGGYANLGPGAGSGAALVGSTQDNNYGGYSGGFGGGAGGGGVVSTKHGSGHGCGGGGGGGFARGVFQVTPGDILNLTVGASAPGHYNQGGRSGGSFIFIEY